jgi:hypothetical protein
MPKINIEGIQEKRMHLSYDCGKICYKRCPLMCEVRMKYDAKKPRHQMTLFPM